MLTRRPQLQTFSEEAGDVVPQIGLGPGLGGDIDAMSPDEIFGELINRMQAYHPSSDFTLVEKAYRLAKSAHEGQVRRSGEPYIFHPLMTAAILADLELDRETIAAGILHDIIEDTDYGYNDIKSMFTAEVANLVDGVTKLEIYAKKRDASSKEEEQAENYRKMFLAMAHDIRVILIKIADRLHNLRTLKFMSPEKQRSIAQESLDIYAPLAGRLGISALRRELEDLSFRYSNPEDYQELKVKISMKRAQRLKHVEAIEDAIKDVLKKHHILARVEGRPKHFFSIYKKMKNQNKGLDQIFDLFAVRIILDAEDKHHCYSALGAVRSVFTPIPERLKDYIATPKSNDYQSLHDSLIGPGGDPFEVQIRTREMNRIAEYGIAAHWKYKEDRVGSDSAEMKLNWLKEILEAHRDTPDNIEFLEGLKGELDVYSDFIHIFTPKGEVKILVKGSTCVDFAYSIHSAIGNKMTGALVNHEMKPKDYVLQNGEQVEIITNQAAKGPTAEWLKFVKTGQAKNKIKQWLKKENKEESFAKGKEMLEKAAKARGLALSKLLTPQGEARILTRYGHQDFNTICASVGRGIIREYSIIKRLHAEYIKLYPEAAEPENVIEEIRAKVVPKRRETRHAGDIIIQGEDNLARRYAQCCSPVFGDPIVGFITRGRGVSIHRADCRNIRSIKQEEKPRLVEVAWGDAAEVKHRFYVDLNIACDKMSLMAEVTEVLGKMGAGIVAFNARQFSDEAVFTLAVSVAGREELDRLLSRLSSIKGVHQVDRIMT